VVYMSHKLLLSIILVVIVTFYLSCNKSNPVASAESINLISFLDKGPVIASTITTLVAINPVFITYIKTQNGNSTDSWSNKILAEDYSLLTSIIKDNNLMSAADPVPSSNRGEVCLGHQGITIVMQTQSTVDTLNISGQIMCKRSLWPIGLPDLVALKDSLVKKYKS
jgi:hypothetical protein